MTTRPPLSEDERAVTQPGLLPFVNAARHWPTMPLDRERTSARRAAEAARAARRRRRVAVLLGAGLTTLAAVAARPPEWLRPDRRTTAHGTRRVAPTSSPALAAGITVDILDEGPPPHVLDPTTLIAPAGTYRLTVDGAAARRPLLVHLGGGATLEIPFGTVVLHPASGVPTADRVTVEQGRAAWIGSDGRRRELVAPAAEPSRTEG